MNDLRHRLLLEHRSDLVERLDALDVLVEEEGASPECARIAHALKGAALTLGLPGLAVAAAALEAASDEDGGDPHAARRAVDLGRRELDAATSPGARWRHELRGHLGVVVGHAGLIELEPLSGAQRESLAEILAATDRITDLLDRLEGGPIDPEPAPSGSPAAVDQAPVASHSVLLVEDDPATSQVVSRMLVKLGASVTVAQSGLEALDAVEAGPFDLVILDLGLPDGDGRDVLRGLRATPGLGAIPIAVSSGDGGASLGRELVAEGATVVLPKPVTLEALRGLVLGL